MSCWLPMTLAIACLLAGCGGSDAPSDPDDGDTTEVFLSLQDEAAWRVQYDGSGGGGTHAIGFTDGVVEAQAIANGQSGFTLGVRVLSVDRIELGSWDAVRLRLEYDCGCSDSTGSSEITVDFLSDVPGTPDLEVLNTISSTQPGGAWELSLENAPTEGRIRAVLYLGALRGRTNTVRITKLELVGRRH